MDPTSPFISKSSSPFTNPVVTVPRTPITTGITATFTFYSFFNYLAKSWKLFFLSLSFNFTLWLAGTIKSAILQVLFICLFSFFLFFFFSFFFFFFLTVASLVFWPGLGYPFISQNPRRFSASHSLGEILGCAYTIIRMVIFITILTHTHINGCIWLDKTDTSCLPILSLICLTSGWNE